MLSRLVALLIGTLALASLRGQFDALAGPLAFAPLADKLWFLAGYFTILTNLGVAGLMFAVARGWVMPARVAGGMLVAIVMVALVYHAILARLWSPQGAAWWADQGLHSAVPLAVAGWWLGFGAKDLGWRDLPFWLIWPGVYGAYALLRGGMTGVWPYPFLDADSLGYGAVMLNIAGLLIGFVALGMAEIALARSVRKPRLVK